MISAFGRFPRDEQYPWQRPPLNEWTIVGMNHYYDSKKYCQNGRALYVAMRKGDLCISAEGPDSNEVWNDLAVKTILAPMPKEFRLDFDPHKSEDRHLQEIFKDNYGGLVWCALRHARLADQFFNEKVAAMLVKLREHPNWIQNAHTISSEIPRSILGNSENPYEWGEALHRMVCQLQGLWHFRFKRSDSHQRTPAEKLLKTFVDTMNAAPVSGLTQRDALRLYKIRQEAVKELFE